MGLEIRDEIRCQVADDVHTACLQLSNLRGGLWNDSDGEMLKGCLPPPVLRETL